MSFTSLHFIFYFLPIFLIAYHLLPPRFRHHFLLLGSYLFYAWASVYGALALFVLTLMDFWLGIVIGRTSAGKKKAYLVGGLAVHLLILVYARYANFLVGELSGALAFFGMASIPWKNTLVLLGISFVTFHRVSYLVDVYRGSVPPERRFVNYANYIALFPKLMQGPIVRYGRLRDEFTSRRVPLDDVYGGLLRFMTGMGKKVLIADTLGTSANKIFALGVTDLTTGYAWVGMLCYTFQIYFDFAGYTDMALGIGRMLGITLPENFNRPYVSQNITEFWKRWHMTLTGWFREYLYIPLGGNRVSRGRMYLNLWVVFLVSGIWHGANWTFILWGAYHGFFLVLDRLFWVEKSRVLGRLINTALAFLVVGIGWVLFRSETLGQAFHFIATMFNPFVEANHSSRYPIGFLISNRETTVLIIAAFLSFFPERQMALLGDMLKSRLLGVYLVGIQSVGTILLFIFSMIYIISNTYQPFIYLRF